jgi:hypothetical protein
MKFLKSLRKILKLTIFAFLLSFLANSFPLWASEKNSLTFINQSGEDALVKLVGPSYRVVEVPNKGKQTVNIAGGEYRIYVRYGKGPRYRCAKGEMFKIEDSAYTYTRAQLTLHGVINGNYHTYGSSEDEFNRQ